MMTKGCDTKHVSFARSTNYNKGQANEPFTRQVLCCLVVSLEFQALVFTDS